MAAALREMRRVEEEMRKRERVEEEKRKADEAKVEEEEKEKSNESRAETDNKYVSGPRTVQLLLTRSNKPLCFRLGYPNWNSPNWRNS